MQDEHFLKSWNEGHAAFSNDLAVIATAASAAVNRLLAKAAHIGKGHASHHSRTSLRVGCRGRSGLLFARAIPLGLLAGAALAGAIATVDSTERASSAQPVSSAAIPDLSTPYSLG